MTGIYTYSVAILMGVAVFGAILGLMRILNNRRLHLAQGVIQGLENAALTDLGEQDLPERGLREEEGLPARPSFFWYSLRGLDFHFSLYSQRLFDHFFCKSGLPLRSSRHWKRGLDRLPSSRRFSGTGEIIGAS